MTITATFSNGFTDTYKGKRDVKAAWMITSKADGKVLMSGHSLDRIKASKTAEGNVRYAANHLVEYCIVDVPSSTRAYGAAYMQSQIQNARRLGLLDDTPRGSMKMLPLFRRTCERVRAYSLEANAARRAAVNIEVIDI